MRKFQQHIFVALIFATITANAQYDKLNVTLLSHWYNPATVAEKYYGIKYNGVWGWTNPADSKKYAIMGSSDGTYFIEVTNPVAPVMRDYVAGRRDSCIWREYKTYDKYLYMVSDDAAPNSFQIIDMSYLPDSVHVVLDNDSIFVRSHTVYIDGDKLYCGSVKEKTGITHSMSVYSLSNPEIPLLLHSLSDDFSTPAWVHDMFVRNDTVYASGGYDGLYIYKFETNNTFSFINSLTSYTEQGYNHSSFLTPNGKTLVFCDEVPVGLGVKILDVSDLQNLTVLKVFRTNVGPTPHNPYVIGNDKAVISYYADGLQIFDISDPANPVRTGYFDTDTISNLGNGYPGGAYQGNWGAYVDFGGGLMLAGDMQNGLYVLDASAALAPLGIATRNPKPQTISLYPNPASENSTLTIKGVTEKSMLKIVDVLGNELCKTIIDPASETTIHPPALSKGVYFYSVTSVNRKNTAGGKLVVE